MRRLLAFKRVLAGALFALIAGATLSLGAVHPFAYVAVWVCCGALAIAHAACRREARALRALVGPHRVGLHPSGRWLVLHHEAGPGEEGDLDLRVGSLLRGPLAIPVLLLAAWAALQLVPLPAPVVETLGPGRRELLGLAAAPWGPISVAPERTLRSLAFLAAALITHVVAAGVLDTRAARLDFTRRIAWFGALIAIVALLQSAAGTRLIYGFFEPIDRSQIFGPFVNRNHFAGYMLLAIPLCFELLAHAYATVRRHAGSATNLRRRLVALASPEGTRLIYAALPPLFCLAALLATQSRGGLIAFLAALLVAFVAGGRRTSLVPWVVGLVLLGLGLSWFGMYRLEQRFSAAPGDATQRTIVWRASAERLKGFWPVGSGLGTFEVVVNRPQAWTLPRGATPLELAGEVRRLEGGASFRKLMLDERQRNLGWFAEAHNDYLQLFLEGGVPGLLLCLWAAGAVVRSARTQPWLLAALVGILIHELVDFDLQIPAIALLFACLASLGTGPATQPSVGADDSLGQGV